MFLGHQISFYYSLTKKKGYLKYNDKMTTPSDVIAMFIINCDLLLFNNNCFFFACMPPNLKCLNLQFIEIEIVKNVLLGMSWLGTEMLLAKKKRKPLETKFTLKIKVSPQGKTFFPIFEMPGVFISTSYLCFL